MNGATHAISTALTSLTSLLDLTEPLASPQPATTTNSSSSSAESVFEAGSYQQQPQPAARSSSSVHAQPVTIPYRARIIEGNNHFDYVHTTESIEVTLSPNKQFQFDTSLPSPLVSLIDADAYRATIEGCNTAFSVKTGNWFTDMCKILAIASWLILWLFFNANPTGPPGPPPDEVLFVILAAVFLIVPSWAVVLIHTYVSEHKKSETPSE